MNLRIAALAVMLPFSSLLPTSLPAAEPPKRFPVPEAPADPGHLGRGVQRTMTLLATSTPTRRNTVRVLFYGQSITASPWAKEVGEWLKQSYPNADLVIENRAIGGFSSERLVKTAETDLYDFVPDLLIFHVYGSHVRYEEIIRAVVRRTTAEVLIQTDHFSRMEDLAEPTDPAKLSPKEWSPWFNYVFLPGLEKRYPLTLFPQRLEWRRYLEANNLQPGALLTDSVHLNPHGRYLMAELIKRHLVYRPELDEPLARSPFENARVHTVRAGDAGLKIKGDVATLEFEGNRVDLVAGARGLREVTVRVDGAEPGAWPEAYGWTRSTYYPGSGWPCVMGLKHQAPLVEEEWTLTLTGDVSDPAKVAFSLRGSVTGPDGEGRSDTRFVSRSGRVVIEPDDWNLEYGHKVHKKPIPQGMEIKWRAVPRFVTRARLDPSTIQAGVEPALTVLRDLPGGKHTLELRGPGVADLDAVRVYRPALFGSGS